MDLNWATVVLLAQDESTLAFLRALYDQSAQLLTLSTATAAIFISLSGPQLNFVDGFSCVRDKVPGKVLILFRLA